ncbi:DUF218 domain-containing protein [Truncatella angustata]|uniref:DUF218 domain-containing protein n=1 Tax=Truncatella angustata TaxID=152316 RepID=A0A9P8UKC8_9PEZI|nr:DUF218 domain-containing protein [Truncatella angustata]KAH6653804.1 DUF218 domain-containing protein [Truncatella angustata]
MSELGSETQLDHGAAIIYEYHRMHMAIHGPVDAVFCLCSLDVRVAERAAELFLSGFGKFLIFSGGSGKLTQGRFDKPEAVMFAERARAMGVNPEQIIVEPLSTNTGENVRFTWKLLEEMSLRLNSFVLVQKPYMERRTYATFKKQWPDESTMIIVTSPQLAWDDYPDNDNPRDLVTNIMVGDLIRIRDYPKMGFQIYQEIPAEVMEVAERLIARGYSHHLP